MVVKRRFIRIEEIEQKTPLTKGDVLELVENGELSFSARVNLKRLGAQHPKENYAVCGVFDYDGIVGLYGKESVQFALKLQSHEVSSVIVKQPEKVKRWGSVGTKFGEIRSSLVEYRSNFYKCPAVNFLAYVRLVHEQKLLHAVQNLGFNMANNLVRGYGQQMDASLKADDTPCLQTKPITISPDNLRLDLEEIEALMGSAVSQLEATIKKPQTLTHPFAQIIHRVLQEYPDIEAGDIWELIKNDVIQDGRRKYDIEAVIDEMTNDVVNWFGRGDTMNSMKYSSFRSNTLPRVREFIDLQK
ncbi:hypothetical protein [Vibrio marisflavi]|uniref:DUF932 domain-containing protein n=1 Tax=Vibrio marisflavi CECT 7928 TaxID=634439 RepID=A0ABN8E7A4_9VIBR|nr:hypothetical protein [Vibrio marisflavi]CAH0540911.1 hypothetical protein VMF7928_03230 [Vibrio marisflavi CECT 7928]